MLSGCYYGIKKFQPIYNITSFSSIKVTFFNTNLRQLQNLFNHRLQQDIIKAEVALERERDQFLDFGDLTI